jgi:hypothetical protein
MVKDFLQSNILNKMIYIKFLPVEGKLEQGDKYVFRDSYIKTFSVLDLECIEDRNRGAVKVKPFIVTNNIKKGDMILVDNLSNRWINGKVTSVYGNYLEVNLGWSSTQTKVLCDCVKVLSEVSSLATWVIDGQEIEIFTNFNNNGKPEVKIKHPETGELF